MNEVLPEKEVNKEYFKKNRTDYENQWGYEYFGMFCQCEGE